MKIEFFYLTLKNPWKNLSWEEYILTRYTKNKKNVYLIFYENVTSVILGRSLILEEEVYPHKIDIPVLRRMSGGGSVVHIPGNINYSLIFSLEEFSNFFSIQESYRLILTALCNAFFQKNIILYHMGLSDLAVVQKGRYKKISGNSQARKKGFLMHHGTFLYNLQQKSKINYYLKAPFKQPKYRKNRAHEEFMITSSLGLSKNQIIHLLIKAFKNLFPYHVLEMKNIETTLTK